MNNKSSIILLWVVIILGAMLIGTVAASNGIISDKKVNEDYKIVKTTEKIELVPSTYPELLTRTRTKQFINLTRTSPENNASSMEQIYYRLASLKILDQNLNNLSASTRDYWINQILSFQNTDGGFGGWKYDRSSVSHTYQALESLDWLGYASLNTTAVSAYLDRLRNSLTDGYNSHLFDSDSDVYSTYLATKAYELLGTLPSNDTEVADVFIEAQNLDPSEFPANEIGGFGMQTNSAKEIYWTSEVVITRAALIGLSALGSSASDNSSALTFLKNLQTVSGGFVNDPYSTTTSSSYTTAALEAIFLLAGTPLNATKAIEYLSSLETPDGSFKLKETSSDSSLKGTYFALYGLQLLGSQPSNITLTLNYLLNWIPTEGGFGGVPGEDPTLRETFDGVAALDLMGIVPHNAQEIINYVALYRNPDGGYGVLNSYTESTLRAVVIHHLLGVPFPNPSETINFLQYLQKVDGGFVRSAGVTTSYVVSTYRAIYALDLLGAQPIDSTKAINYLKSTQNGDGGFGGFSGDSSDVTSTYRGIRALNILGDTSYNIASAKSFLLQSQNPDGGFKRSPSDVVRPKNISHSVYSYSAVRAMLIIGETPNSIPELYDYILSVRNRDGGFAEHPRFSSNIAYTYTSLWLLRYFHEISGFSISLPTNLNKVRNQYNNFTLELNGKFIPLNYTLTLENTSEVLSSDIKPSAGAITIDTSSFAKATYLMRIVASDPTGVTINETFPVLIADIPSGSSSSSTPIPTPIEGSISILTLLLMAGTLLIIRKRRSRQL